MVFTDISMAEFVDISMVVLTFYWLLLEFQWFPLTFEWFKKKKDIVLSKDVHVLHFMGLLSVNYKQTFFAFQIIFSTLFFNSSLDEKQDSLNRRQKNLLSEWDVRKTEVSDWLTDTSTKLKSQDSAVTNVDAVRDQSQKLQVKTG